jgi:hypothetical protein
MSDLDRFDRRRILRQISEQVQSQVLKIVKNINEQLNIYRQPKPIWFHMQSWIMGFSFQFYQQVQQERVCIPVQRQVESQVRVQVESQVRVQVMEDINR